MGPVEEDVLYVHLTSGFKMLYCGIHSNNCLVLSKSANPMTNNNVLLKVFHHLCLLYYQLNKEVSSLTDMLLYSVPSWMMSRYIDCTLNKAALLNDLL